MRILGLLASLILFGFITSTAKADNGVGRSTTTETPTESPLYNGAIAEIIFKELCATPFTHCRYTFAPYLHEADGTTWDQDTHGFEPLGGACAGELSVTPSTRILAFMEKFELGTPIQVEDLWPNGYMTSLWTGIDSEISFSCTDGIAGFQDLDILILGLE